jgi:fatty acid desaturase
MFKQFRRDPLFFLKYNLWSVAILGVASVLLYLYWSDLSATPYSWLLFLCVMPFALPNLWMISVSALSLTVVAFYLGLVTLTAFDWLWVVAGTLIGLQSAWLMHNAAHDSIQPAWLNRVIGEVCGLQQLMGFPGWAVPHIIHHQNPDDPESDPHPPQYQTFMQYLSAMGPSMARVATRNFHTMWSERSDLQRLWKYTALSSMGARYLRAVFLLLLLGTKIFVLGFIVSKIVNMVFYVHFNFATHRPAANGEIEILNLDHNFYYKFTNATMAGMYFHKNHHAKASLFDPRRLDKGVDKRLVTYTYRDGK